MASLSFVPLEEMVARLERALAGSPADATELVWLDAVRSQESNGNRRRDRYELAERSLLVRVCEAGRSAVHRTSLSGLSELDKAIREALAQARLAPRSQPMAPAAADPLHEIPGLWDPEVARLTAARAKELIQQGAGRGETARLGWTEGRMAVVNSRGMRRSVEATAAWIEVSCGPAPGAGSAAAVCRSLAGLDLPAVWARARQRNAATPEIVADPPAGPVPMALAPEAAATLIDLLNRHALSSLSFLDGRSFLSDRIGQQVFHPAFNLRDEPLLPRGVPFPCDLLGAAKKPMDLIRGGVFLGPVREEQLARKLDLAPTPHLIAPDEALASHPVLLPLAQPGVQPDAPSGRQQDGELLQRAAGGLWAGRLAAAEVFDPRGLRFRAVIRGVRQITAGLLGPPLPDLLWEGCLASLFAGELAIGGEAIPVRASGDPLFGAVSAPLLVLAAVHGLRPDPTPRS